ncbi:alternative ribosome rescue aminoacyl-tRNA hydrolase ArfB [Crateriforma conspicua]|uniref:alternative ribosome rescue aminoacyl-tRNA hydrolase ArfB n=1 Tax=Crateriforma conspicua TaxID=2527996 RepID=UPI00118790F7|nr:alternative ribosome rescue aminoacyl-tRNA hydrolase ArfB [Crateriforma conspicua]QDV64649.1 Peptidyl-tRNA hydrolase ArfB [Crateriforma conspicua]
MSDLVVNRRLTLPAESIQISHSRSSGPGGQNVNKVNSRVTLRWSPGQCDAMPEDWKRRFMARQSNRITRDGDLVLHSDRFRDQPSNLADVRQRLVDLLLECQWPPKARKATRPSRSSNKKRLKKKKQHSQKKQLRRSPIPRD